MFTIRSMSAISLGFALPLQALALAGGAENQKRELGYAMRQHYAREVYTVDPTPNPPTCAAGFDEVDPVTGDCSCGPGRVQVTDGTCGVAPGASDFRITEIVTPQAIARPITWSAPTTGPGETLNAPQCAGVCAQDLDCIGFYLTPAEGLDTALCWSLGADGTYDSPSGTGLPFTPSGGSRMVRRADGVTGAIGAPGGNFGIALETNAVNPAIGCNPDFGDVANADLSGCTCGPGRVNNADGACFFAPSAAARMARRVKRDAYEGVPW